MKNYGGKKENKMVNKSKRITNRGMRTTRKGPPIKKAIAEMGGGEKGIRFMTKQFQVVKVVPANLPDEELPLVNISEQGLKALRDDSSLSDDTRLTLEIVALHPKGLTEREVDVLVDAAIDFYGGNAALKLGQVQIVFDDGRGQ